jgi:hypothetical protein
MVIGQNKVSFQSRRSEMFQFPDQPLRVVQTRPQLLVQSRTPQMCR